MREQLLYATAMLFGIILIVGAVLRFIPYIRRKIERGEINYGPASGDD